MVKIVYDGMCEGCECADLQLEYVPGVNIPENERWALICKHEFACDQMERKVKLRKMFFELDKHKETTP